MVRISSSGCINALTIFDTSMRARQKFDTLVLYTSLSGVVVTHGSLKSGGLGFKTRYDSSEFGLPILTRKFARGTYNDEIIKRNLKP